MKDNSIILCIAEVLVGATGLASLAYGYINIAEMCAVALIAMTGGHLNGTHTDDPTPSDLQNQIDDLNKAIDCAKAIVEASKPKDPSK